MQLKKSLTLLQEGLSKSIPANQPNGAIRRLVARLGTKKERVERYCSILGKRVFGKFITASDNAFISSLTLVPDDPVEVFIKDWIYKDMQEQFIIADSYFTQLRKQGFPLNEEGMLSFLSETPQLASVPVKELQCLAGSIIEIKHNPPPETAKLLERIVESCELRGMQLCSGDYLASIFESYDKSWRLYVEVGPRGKQEQVNFYAKACRLGNIIDIPLLHLSCGINPACVTEHCWDQIGGLAQVDDCVGSLLGSIEQIVAA